MKIMLALAMSLVGCGGGGGRTEHYAVGATDYYASPNKCSIVGAPDAVVELKDHYKAKDGKGVVFEAVKPGTAKVDCGDSSATIVVAEVARVELQRVDAAKTPAALGTYAFAEVITTRAQFSVRSGKEMVRRVVNGQVRDDEDTLHIRNSSFDTEDFAEGVRSFLEKRPPRFKWS